jgi:hypothetical protein
LLKTTNSKKLAGKSQGSAGYMHVVVMLIESYVLESIWLLAMVIFFDQAVFSFFGASLFYIEVSLP